MGARLLLSALLLAGCSGPPGRPDAPTADEERQLKEAAASLDANSVGADDAAGNGAER